MMQALRNQLATADILDRYVRACDLKQTVDRSKIEEAILLWAHEIGAPTETGIIFVSSGQEIASAARASAARVSANVASAARARAARANANAARAAAWGAWGAWDVAYYAITAIGAVSIGDDKIAKVWLPILSAFEAGAFALWLSDAEIFVATIPTKVQMDENCRLHCEDGPAFVWLSDIADYYWHGTPIPHDWLARRDTLAAAEIFKEENAETRRAGCEIIGWNRVLTAIKARLIDEDGDPQIGVLYEGQIPGASRCGFLKVECGTGREFVICTPPDMSSAIEAQAWIQNVPAGSWVKPEVRG